jgi:hypothetical protein
LITSSIREEKSGNSIVVVVGEANKDEGQVAKR